MENEKGFLLLKPRMPANSDRIARAIAMCKGVKEVFLTSGEYAFVVSVESNMNAVRKSIKKITRTAKVSAAIKHHLYKN